MKGLLSELNSPYTQKTGTHVPLWKRYTPVKTLNTPKQSDPHGKR